MKFLLKIQNFSDEHHGIFLLHFMLIQMKFQLNKTLFVASFRILDF